MAKVADIRLFWVKSPSSDIVRQRVMLTINGTTTQTDLDPAAEQLMIEVQALGVVSFHIVTFDAENNQVTSETWSFTVGDLELPLPATNLGHEIVAIRDVP